MALSAPGSPPPCVVGHRINGRVSRGLFDAITSGTGSFDIFAGATFSNNEQLVDFVTNQLSKVDGIVRVNTRTSSPSR